ncbi:uncharacterized protein BX664DRAFT_388695 [Halteromyces radiatus]|uniref:uncharacterized protein n=1 Tax=Halteromyces radiatus TaxID=101107 RepID=UPI0022208332|nr:uncharacterized protein BX664DRAFT_388695 [Halteromyces radiatus]KAI8081764.1 hypothetical protein BX664DRAFT_388695 [Halteromyces radiatus]
MGNNISNVTAIVGVDSYVSELGDVYYEKSLGNARFMKTIRGRHKDGLVVVKIFVKPKLGLSLRQHVKQLQREYDAIYKIPNVFTFQKILETDRAAYLVRQYFYSSLYDRISTRPFLTLVEKKWISYQILRGVADCHQQNVYHGDIKTENILVTSWNWTYLVDFASYKPTFLPEDDPADFSFFFDTSSRRSCYIAPERFYKAGTDIDRRLKSLGFGFNNILCELTPEMDIFSVGCVIAELFLEGSSIFSLSQLFKYQNDEYDPSATLDKMGDSDIKDMVLHMIQIDPTKRFSAEQYLQEWRGKVFPDYFYNFMHEYIGLLTDKNETLPSKIQTVENNFMTAMSPALPLITQPHKKLVSADEKMERLYHDFERIFRLLSHQELQSSSTDESPFIDGHLRERRRTLSDLPFTTTSMIILPPTLNIPNYDNQNSSIHSNNHSSNSGEQGYLIILSFVCSLVRNTLYASSKLKSLDILLALAEHVPDDVKLDRLIPYVMILLSDESALVRSNALKVLTQVLCIVESISPINARIFPEYILPSVREFTTDPNVMVRTTYASCIALLSETALRFLEMTQLLLADNAFPLSDIDAEELDFESAYDSSLQDLQTVIQEQVTTLLIDSESMVKRALLTDITCLCVFFGRQKANDVLLSHMITYLNDKDWMLRSAFFESVKGVGTFVGARSLEEYILPLMIQALTDAEEFVVEKVLNSLTSLADLGLFQKMKLWELVGIVSPLICHPNIWIRYGAIGFISSATKHLPQTDRWCIIYPLLTPFLRSDIADINEESLLHNVKSPIPRQVYEQTILWANRASNQSIFWKPQQQSKRGSRLPDSTLSKSKSVGPATLIRQGSVFNGIVSHDELNQAQEDRLNLERLRNVGMTNDDELKLLYMREYIFKVSRTKSSRTKGVDDITSTSGEIVLTNLGVTPVTVFLPDLSQQVHTWNSKHRMVSTQQNDTVSRASTKESKSRGDNISVTNHIANQPHVQAILQDVLPESGSKTSTAPNHGFGTSVPVTKDDRMQEDVIKAVHRSGFIGYQDDMNKLISRNIESDSSEIQDSTPSTVGYSHLQRILYKTAMEAFPPHIPEFIGDPSVMKRIRRLPQGTSSLRTIGNWKPEGTLVAHFTEHTAGINQLAISWDNLLFASCSDDGTVKIWDCSRLERNVTNRSRTTYNKQGGSIKCITFIQQTYSIASASDNGSIHIFRVDLRSSGSSLKFGKCITVREYQLVDEYALIVQHFTSNAFNTMTGSKSILLVATNKENIYLIDLLTMNTLVTLKNRKSYGIITSMVTDRLHTWLLVGTTRGILTLYDMRFQIPLYSWLHPSKSRISRMMLNHDPRAEGKQVIIASGKNEVSIWNIAELKCLEVYGVKSGDEKTTGISMEMYKALEVPSDTEIMFSTFTSQETNYAENTIRAISSPSDSRFMLTGGADRKLRFWDMNRIENSAVILGLDIDEAKPRYSSNTHDNIHFHFEFTHQRPSNQNSTSSISNRASSHVNQHQLYNGLNTSVVQQQHLMRNHTDAITDIVFTEIPYLMIISGDRDGVIKVIS